MLLCSYSIVVVADPKGGSEARQYGLILRPRSRGYVWHLRCDSVEERRKWKSVFSVRRQGAVFFLFGCVLPLHAVTMLLCSVYVQRCAMASGIPSEANWLQRVVFTNAFLRMRWRMKRYNFSRFDGGGEATLTGFITRRAEDQVMEAVLADARARTPVSDKTRNEVGAMLDEGVALQISAAWKSLEFSLRAHKDVTHVQATEQLRNLIAARRRLKYAEVSMCRVRSLTGPVLHDLFAGLL